MKSLKEVVAEVKLAYNIADYVSKSGGVSLKQVSPGKWKGLCPFHNEKTPSFVVDERFQNYKCWGCGAGGDLLSFVQETESMDFFDAIRKLADDKGIQVEISNDEPTFDRKSVKKCLTATAVFFYKHFMALPEDHAAKREITKRNLPETDKFYGYAPEKRGALLEFLRKKGFSDQTISFAGVCGKNSESGQMFDFWSGRLMFFIRDISGGVVGFSGRKLFDTDTRGKYVNSPDGPLFKKGNVLFNLSSAKKEASETEVIHVVEGQFDVAAMVDSGLRNTVASSGTAFTADQAGICKRIVGENGKILFCLDGDAAGQAAAKKVFKNCKNIQEMSYVVVFPDGQDPCDYRLEHGNEALAEFCKNNVRHMIDFMLDTEESKIDFDSEAGRSEYVVKVAPLLKTISSAPLRENYARKVSLQSFVPLDVIRKEIESAKIEDGFHEPESKNSEEVSDRPALEEPEKISAATKVLEDEIYEIAARWISLAMNDENVRNFLFENSELLPEEMKMFSEEMKNMKVFVPENFSDSELAKTIIENNFFPFLEQMEDSDREDISKRFMQILSDKETEYKMRKVKASVSRYLNSSPGTAEFLKKAMSAEKKKLSELFDIVT